MHADLASLETIFRERDCWRERKRGIAFQSFAGYVLHLFMPHNKAQVRKEHPFLFCGKLCESMRIYIRRGTRAQSSVSDCGTNDAQCCGNINHAPAAPPQCWESSPQEEILQAVLRKTSQGGS